MIFLQEVYCLEKGQDEARGIEIVLSAGCRIMLSLDDAEKLHREMGRMISSARVGALNAKDIGLAKGKK